MQLEDDFYNQFREGDAKSLAQSPESLLSVILLYYYYS